MTHTLEYSLELVKSFKQEHRSHLISRCWASMKINHLMQQYEKNKALVQEVRKVFEFDNVQLANQFGIVTEKTSFIVLETLGILHEFVIYA